MTRLLFIAVAASGVLLAAPTAAQQQQTEGARQAGLRYLTWPGRPPIQQPPARAARPSVAPARLSPTTTSETPAERSGATPTTTPVVQPSTSPSTTGATVTPTATGTTGQPRYYSVHRQSGRAPDPIDRARVLAAEDTLVALQSPQGQSLAEQDRNARADEAFEILRNLPPDQLMEMLGRQP